MNTMLKTIIFLSVILFIAPANGFLQQSDAVLILLDRTKLEHVPRDASLKIYSFDDDYLFGEIALDNLSVLDNFKIPYQIIDEKGWSGEYYLVSRRPMGLALDKIQQGEQLFRLADRVFVKTDFAVPHDFFDANFNYERVTRIEKPLPKPAQFFVLTPVVDDSIVRKIIDKVSAENLRADVQRLQDFQTRYTHSDSIIPAGQWIYDKYRSLGYTDVKFDTFYINNVAHRNVVATKPGLIYPDSVIMIGGHFDSIVLGSGTDRFVWAPGADDNASGTVGGIEAARVFVDHDFEATIKFVAWDAEEIGLVGSDAYAQKAYYQNEPISLLINLDMIANVNPNDPLNNATIFADAPTMPYANFMAEMAKRYTTLVPHVPGNSAGSDHRSFQMRGYRALFGHEGDFSPHWHKVTDITDNMDFDYMKEFMQMTLATIIQLAVPADNYRGKPYVKYFTHVLDDDMDGASIGNGNGYIDAGETLELSLIVKNYGDMPASNVDVTITSSSQFVDITHANQSFGSISPNSIAASADKFVLRILPETPSGEKLTLNVKISDGYGNSWNDRVNLTVQMPEFVFLSQQTSEVSGNGDDKIEAGETFDLFVELKNSGLRDAAQIETILRCEHQSITLLDSTARYENISMSASTSNWSDKFTVAIASDAKPEIIPLSIVISEGMGFYRTIISFNLAIGQGKILLVEDDGRFDLSHYYKETLNLLGIHFLHWNTNERGAVASDTLMKYDRVIWYTGSEFNNSFYRKGTGALEQYLDNGGKLFINGPIFALTLRDSSFLADYLKIKYLSFKTDLHHLKSVTNNSVFGNIDFWLSTSGDNSQSLTGEIDTLGIAQPILVYNTKTSEGAGNILSKGIAGVAVADSYYRAIAFSFAWEGIADSKLRQEALIRILNWLEGIETTVKDEAEVPINFNLAQNYPNPFNATTRIRFDIPNSSYVTLKIFNVMGQEVRRLITSDLSAGSYHVAWDGRDSQNRAVSSGIYLYQIVAGDFKQTRKMMLIY